MIPQADLDAMRVRWSGKTIVLMPVTDGVRRGPITPSVREVWVEDAAARTDVPRLLDAYEELRGLARDLAGQLRAMPHDLGCDRDTCDDAWRCACGRTTVLAKARAAGLLEPAGE